MLGQWKISFFDKPQHNNYDEVGQQSESDEEFDDLLVRKRVTHMLFIDIERFHMNFRVCVFRAKALKDERRKFILKVAAFDINDPINNKAEFDHRDM